MAGPVHGSARALLAALLAPALVALVALLVAPARGRGGRDHGDWDTAGLLPPLPPREDAARVARFVTHVCDWGALATISHAGRGGAAGPFADVLSLSEGAPGAGSGVPYFYLSPLFHQRVFIFSFQENPSATLTMSLAQTNFCRKHGFDPQSPLCAHIILSGTVTKVNETEVDVAKQSLFIRHPEMKDWPSSHNWFFAKLNITNIWLLDYFGGPKIVTPEEYYNATFQ
ncbi:LOW QUALITY PROTEIN: protein CREG1 [Myotis lucifugus]|uniref:LOW QUALITY PROTEIN: protein CREG1 n=1 Tax=Myotis lucifugus TaxID=59463 RepID=UPI0003C422EF|nr:LOW QUALITY PROTEIN: protein CREG1 [Myotis lucifugus]